VRFLAIATGLVSGLLGGCRASEAGSELRTDGPRAPVSELSEPTGGKALIHVIRGDEGADAMDVKLTADLLGTIVGRDYVAAEVEPGNYVLGCFLTYFDRDPVHTFATVRLTAGRAQYFLAKKVTSPPRPGAYAEEIAILIEELDPAEGERLLPALRRVTLAEEAPASIPFRREVAAAEVEPATAEMETTRLQVETETETPAPVPEPVVTEPVAVADDTEQETPLEDLAGAEQPEGTAGNAELVAESEVIEAPPVGTGAEAEPDPKPEDVAGAASEPESDESQAAETTPASDEVEAWIPVEVAKSADEPKPDASRPPPTRIYKGPRRARSRIAHLVMGDRVYVSSINGIPHDIGPFGSNLAGIRLPTDAFRNGGIELKPGRYRLEVAWHGPRITRKRTYFGTHLFEVELEAGATYTISGVKDRGDVLGWEPKVGKAPRAPAN